MKIYECLISSLVVIFFFQANQIVRAQTPKQLEEHRAHWGTPASADTLKNPFVRSTALIDTGKAIYVKSCSVCHGIGGKGDGVAAAGLAVRPADHTSKIVQAQTDGALFYEISNGHPPMPAFKTVFTEKQRWALINYIRTLGGKPKEASAGR